MFFYGIKVPSDETPYKTIHRRSVLCLFEELTQRGDGITKDDGNCEVTNPITFQSSYECWLLCLRKRIPELLHTKTLDCSFIICPSRVSFSDSDDEVSLLCFEKSPPNVQRCSTPFVVENSSFIGPIKEDTSYLI